MTDRLDIVRLRVPGFALASLLRIPHWTLIGLCIVAAGMAVAFALSSLYALAAGWALPTTAPIRWSGAAAWAARNEPQAGYPLLMLAGIGALSTWVARLAGHSFDLDESSARRALLWAGLPIAAFAFVLSISAMWAGMVRHGDPNGGSIGGLIPFNDAVGYYADAFDQAKNGRWSWAASHRPLAASFRATLMWLANYSLPVMLILQACILASVAWFATLAVARWRGVWSAIAFFALVFIYARTFVPTALTESPGLIWALLSIPFFIEAFRSGDVKPALFAFALTTVALMTRMGSMFTIPALMLWLCLFGRTPAARLRIGAAATAILAAAFGLNLLLQRFFGSLEVTTEGNFPYLICGLTMGTTWTGCVSKLASLGVATNESAELFGRLYAMAWDNFQAHPGVLFERLFDAMGGFSQNFRLVMWAGYSQIEKPHWLWQEMLTGIGIVGIAATALFRMPRIEIAFWMLLGASIYLSAAVMYFEDGARTMAVSQPLIALLFATGVANWTDASAETAPATGHWRYGAGLLVATALLFAVLPWALHRLDSASHPPRSENEALVQGGRRLSGFLVVANDQPLDGHIPTLHLADFEAIVEQSGVEQYQGLLHPRMPPLPFGFIIAPRLERSAASTQQYIVPAEVLKRDDVAHWRFRIAPWNTDSKTPGPFWLFVTRAEPCGDC